MNEYGDHDQSMNEGWITTPAVDYCKGNCKSEAEASKQCSGVGVSLEEQELDEDYYYDDEYAPYTQDMGGGGLLNWLTRSLRVREGKIDRKQIRELVVRALQRESEVNCEFGGPKQVVPENIGASLKGAFNDPTEPDPHYQKICVDGGFTESKFKGNKVMKNKNKLGLTSLNDGWNKFLNESDEDFAKHYKDPGSTDQYDVMSPWDEPVPASHSAKTWAEYGTGDAQKGRPPSPPSPGGLGPDRRQWHEYMDAYKAVAGETVGGSTGGGMNEGYDVGKQVWMKKWQDAAGNPQPPPQDFWDTAMYAYNQGKDPVEAAKDYMSHIKPEKPAINRGYMPEPEDGPGAYHHYQERKMNESWGEDEEYFDALEAEFPFLAKSVKAGEVPEEVAAQIAKEYGTEEKKTLKQVGREKRTEAGMSPHPRYAEESLDEGVLHDEGWLKVVSSDSDNEGSHVEVVANGSVIASGDYDSLAGTFFMKDSQGKSETFEELDALVKHYAGTGAMEEADEGGEGVHDIFNLPEPEEVEPTGNPKEDAIRKIVSDKQHATVDGIDLDLYSASAVVKVLDAINDQNKEKYLAMDVANMVEIAFKMMK